jgi:hypothetical protein
MGLGGSITDQLCKLGNISLTSINWDDELPKRRCKRVAKKSSIFNFSLAASSLGSFCGLRGCRAPTRHVNENNGFVHSNHVLTYNGLTASTSLDLIMTDLER